MSDWITAFAPASIGNVAVGFDMLGLALEGAGDRVLACRSDGDRVTIAEVRGLISDCRRWQTNKHARQSHHGSSWPATLSTQTRTKQSGLASTLGFASDGCRSILVPASNACGFTLRAVAAFSCSLIS